MNENSPYGTKAGGNAPALSVILGAMLLIGSSGCASMSRTTKGGVVGATAGGLAGGVIGNQTGSTARGAIIGAVVGGVA